MKLASSFLFFTALLASASASATRDVAHYSVISIDCRERENGTLLHAFRSFHFDGLPRYLVVNVETFETRLIDPSFLNCKDPSAAAEVATSPYGEASRAEVRPPFPMHNDGIRHASGPVQGTFLTADLCPASKERFEYRLFDELEKIAMKSGRPVSIALSVSGKWIRQHDLDFETIRRLRDMRKLDVTWVNHSDSHPYRKGQKYGQNFLLEPGVVPEREIEGAEQELLRRGEVPSVFFRFPGLVSNKKWIEELGRHSLLPIGADAWIALGQKPVSGSVILIHANGNEPEGVRKFLKQMPEIETLGPFLPLSSLF
ncbi:MAG: hypothetical protein JST04_11040 [Bdellovibrionales bacterium]|nr:hypothetical protein [Bdellovibrionales bacterium]